MRLRSEVEMDEGEERARMQILWKGKAEVGVAVVILITLWYHG